MMSEDQATGRLAEQRALPGSFIATLRRERVVVVMRNTAAETILPELRALYDGGLRVFEITVEAPGALAALGHAREQLPGDALLGAGTVLDGGTAGAAIAAGARFLVSPVLARGVAHVARAHGVPAVLGAMTPSEVHRAFRLGCDAVKVFPASAVGPQFLRELRGPLGFIPLLPTGGITRENARSYLEAGAAAIGVGSALVRHEWVAAGDWDALRDAAGSWAQLKQFGTD